VFRLIALSFVLLACVAPEGRGSDNPMTVTPRLPAARTFSPRSSWRVHTQLVQVPVTVTDPWGSPFRGLAVDDFRLFENGAQQHVAHLTVEDAPVSLGIVFDASGSMEGRLDQARAAVTELLAPGVPGDEYFVVQVGDVPAVICDFTRDTDSARANVSLDTRDGYYRLSWIRYTSQPNTSEVRQTRGAPYSSSLMAPRTAAATPRASS